MPSSVRHDKPRDAAQDADGRADDRPDGYSALQIALHWIVAALVVVQLTVNEDMRRAFRASLDAPDAALAAEGGALVHVVVGLTILALAVLRLGVRLWRGVPPDDHLPLPLRLLARAAHWLLYGFLFGMPLTGAAAWFLGLDLMGLLHETGRLLLVPLILAHAMGALVEHFVMRNDTLLRMLRPTDS